MQQPLLHELLNVLPSHAPPPPPTLIPSLSSSPPLPSSPFDPLSASFRPSIAVIIGVLTTMFSLTFLLLLYAKHCKRHGIGVYDRSDLSIAVASPAPPPPPPPLLRARDSGVDRAIIDILPTFSFSSLHGVKEGLECAVCLSRFEMPDILRLLPKCKHAFHLECVDTWLSNHSTCPLCRNRVEAGDVLIVEGGGKCSLQEQQQSMNSGASLPSSTGRNSNAEAASGVDRAYQLFVQRESDGIGLPPTLDVLSRARNPSRNESIGRSGSRKSKCGAEQPETLLQPSDSDEQDFVRRFSHRIIISDALSQHRWSDFVPSDVLFLSSQTLSAGVRALDAISVSNRNSSTEAMEGHFLPSASTVAMNPLPKSDGKSPSRRDVDAPQGSSARIDAPPRLSNSKIQDIFLSRLTGSRNSSKGAEAGLLHSGSSGDVEVAVSSGKQTKEAKGGVFERQASFLRRVFVAGRPESGSELQMPSYQRSVSEVAGIRQYAENVRIPSNGDEEAKQWLSIARTTLTWILGGGKGRPFAGPSH